MKIDGIEYLTYEELKPIALKEMRDDFANKHLNNDIKFFGDLNKMFDNKKYIGKWISDKGYIRVRKQINNARRFYYIKPNK